MTEWRAVKKNDSELETWLSSITIKGVRDSTFRGQLHYNVFNLKTENYLCGSAARLHDDGVSEPKNAHFWKRVPKCTRLCVNVQKRECVKTMKSCERVLNVQSIACAWILLNIVWHSKLQYCVCASRDFEFIDTSAAKCKFTASLLRAAETHLLHTPHY